MRSIFLALFKEKEIKKMRLMIYDFDTVWCIDHNCRKINKAPCIAPQYTTIYTPFLFTLPRHLSLSLSPYDSTAFCNLFLLASDPKQTVVWIYLFTSSFHFLFIALNTASNSFFLDVPFEEFMEYLRFFCFNCCRLFLVCGCCVLKANEFFSLLLRFMHNHLIVFDL